MGDLAKDPTLVYENPWMRVIEETYRSPTGATATFGVIHKADVALVVPFRPDRDLLRLVRTWRPLFPRSGWEFPQGGIEVSDASPVDAAARELREETGLVASELVAVGGFAEVAGFSSAWVHVFVGYDCAEVPDCRVDEAEIQAHEDHTMSSVDRLIVQGECFDGATLAAIALLQRTGHWSSPAPAPSRSSDSAPSSSGRWA